MNKTHQVDDTHFRLTGFEVAPKDIRDIVDVMQKQGLRSSTVLIGSTAEVDDVVVLAIFNVFDRYGLSIVLQRMEKESLLNGDTTVSVTSGGISYKFKLTDEDSYLLSKLEGRIAEGDVTRTNWKSE